MNAERLIKMLMRMVMRQGMRRLSKNRQQSPEAQRAEKSARMLNRIRRM